MTYQHIINVSADIKQAQDFVACERLRNEFADFYGRKPWAVSLAYGDFGKIMKDLECGRVTKKELWNAADKGRHTGTLDPRYVIKMYDLLSAA